MLRSGRSYAQTARISRHQAARQRSGDHAVAHSLTSSAVARCGVWNSVGAPTAWHLPPMVSREGKFYSLAVGLGRTICTATGTGMRV